MSGLYFIMKQKQNKFPNYVTKLRYKMYRILCRVFCFMYHCKAEFSGQTTCLLAAWRMSNPGLAIHQSDVLEQVRRVILPESSYHFIVKSDISQNYQPCLSDTENDV